MSTIYELVSLIGETHHFFKQQAQRQVNTALTLRNWLFGFYIAEYELNGADRAEYGVKLFKEIALLIEKQGFKQIRERHLYLCKDFYTAYPNILRSVSAKSYLSGLQEVGILRTLSAELLESCINSDIDPVTNEIIIEEVRPLMSSITIEKLINHLSFSHFIELLKADSELKRNFYEVEAIKNNWSVRELQRAMNSMLFERTGLSATKKSVIEKQIDHDSLIPDDVFRNPYILEFLELKEETEYSESELEQAIINHLQSFLLELGKGFCFEARQKRITFDNKHYRIDLVFYHRILRCNVIIDLKIGEFDHSDAGQMNVYLNYYADNEMNVGDNPPIGIILCASKNDNLVKYATKGLPQQVFVNKYMINLPNEVELQRIIEEEQNRIIY